MWMGSTPPIRASCPRRSGWIASPSRDAGDGLARSKVLQVRSVEIAMLHRVPTYVRSSFDDPASPMRHAHLRRGGYRGTAGRHRHRLLKDEAQITLRRVADKPASRRRSSAAGRGQHQCRHDHPGRLDDTVTTDITFTVPTADFDRAKAILEGQRASLGYHRSRARRMWSRCRPSASACGAMPALPRAPSGRWPTRASISAPSPPRRSSSRAD